MELLSDNLICSDWKVVELDLPALIECLNNAYRMSDIEAIHHYSCCIASYIECREVLKKND